VHTAAHDHALIGAVLISAADMGYLGKAPRERVVAEMADDMESLTGVTSASMADELIANEKAFGFANELPGLSQTPLLVLSADDGLAPSTDALVKAVVVEGNQHVTAIHAATDHSWSDHRIFLESTIVTWLAGLK